MNDALKQRLIGALVLLGAAFLFAFLLPSPGQLAVEKGTRKATIDLHAPQRSVEVGDAARLTPPVIAAPGSAPAAGADSAEMAAGSVSGEPDGEAVQEPALAAGPPPTFHAPPVQLKPSERLRVVPPPKPAPTTVAEATPTQPAAPKAPAPAKPAATVASAAQPPAAAPASSTPTPAKDARWSVQIGSFSEVDNARQVESRIQAAGLPVSVAPVTTDKGKLYRVRIGPLSGEGEARAAQAKALQLGFAAATVRHD